ncbi:hypothetical protein ACS0TY_017610 [Phlomoides rotata]
MGSQHHPQYEEIQKELAILNAKMKGLGYIPDFRFVLQDVEDDEKEHVLANHSERLAIMFGILNTPPKTCIRIYKNLRIPCCLDNQFCSMVEAWASGLTWREIMMEDEGDLARLIR